MEQLHKIGSSFLQGAFFCGLAKYAKFVYNESVYLHGGGNVGIGIQRESCAVVAQHSGESFYIYAVL